ncbi:hypothetical protein BPNPMPFG_001350 [Mesorhizobium sp. AR07]|uniref:hypothetical protein n=1 Tax=Mesorhizobium sp. AR07 TaxID=2865838 RepID=UPI002160BCDA|nr:hypothetical protein [Mesorhizobium sp. AR07]UVK45778.1 hypothetical protein BPNPMPFG_001350 [Mesorhizobium sp. AR07]
MLKKIAFVAVLIQVAAFSALTTQTVLFASSTATQAANVRPGETVAVTEKECAKGKFGSSGIKCLGTTDGRRIPAEYQRLQCAP